jgi:uncharacterized protein
MIRLPRTRRWRTLPAGCGLGLVFLTFALATFLATSAESAVAQQLSTPPFFKTSFYCTKAKSLSIEEEICKNEKLASLDLQTAEAYRKRLDSTSTSGKEQVIVSQRRWLTIRNAHDVNPYHGDPPGEIADLEGLYQERIAALRSNDPALLNTAIPKEYEWLQSIAPAGLSKHEFGISRGYASCEDPCQKKPSLYRWISIGGGGIGEEPGDVDTPYAQIMKKLASEGWTKCRSASDSGNPTVDYFTKGNRIVSVSRNYSTGVGNGIGMGITISDPLPQNPPKAPPNPAVTLSDDWITYSSPDVGLQLRFPPSWHVRDDKPDSGTRFKELIFGADDFSGNFTITVAQKGIGWPYENNDSTGCFPSHYAISGRPARECMVEGENVFDSTCTRYLRSLDVEVGKYHLTFEPVQGGSLPDDAGRYKLTNLYERIMSTIEMKQPN